MTPERAVLSSSSGRCRLLVTADDFGAGARRNAGIVAAWRDGIVTGVSLLANGPAFDEAVALARECGIPVGVHLNLADYAPLTGPIPGLTDAAGNFPGKHGSRQRLASGTVDHGALRRELDAQIAKVCAAGLSPVQLDTHQHAILFPSVTAVVVELARAWGAMGARFPRPVEAAAHDPHGDLGAELALYRQLAPAAAATLRAAGLHTPDGLFGMPLLDRLDTSALCDLFGRMQPGVWELMTHPGYHDPGDPFGTPARERELAALTDPTLPPLLQQRGIALINFSELTA